MNGKIRFRRRNAWESSDLGVVLIRERPLFYFALYFCTILPLFVLVSLICWRYPLWAGVIIWWLKPATEGGIVLALARQVFGEKPDFSGSLKDAYRFMWRYRIVGDLLWRRFSLRRAVILPVTVLERVKGKTHATRRREIGYKTAAQSAWLTFFGFHFEMILCYGLLLLLGWLFFHPDQNHLLPELNDYSWQQTMEWLAYLFASEHSWAWHMINFLYILVLSFWQPFFVAGNFSLYLQRRSESEAWDIRLTFRACAEKLGKVMSIICVLFLFSGSLNNTAYAETPPDRQQVEQTRQKTVGSKPFVHLESKKVPKKKQNKNLSELKNPFAAQGIGQFAKIFLWAVAAAFVAGLLFWAWKYLYPQMTAKSPKTAHSVPEKIFGLDIRPDRLPENPIAVAWQLFDTNPREALSLIYRALLVHLVKNEHLPLKDSMTESEILAMVNRERPSVALSAERITQSWILTAYAHTLPDRATMEDLCQHYAVVSRSGSLNKGAANA